VRSLLHWVFQTRGRGLTGNIGYFRSWEFAAMTLGIALSIMNWPWRTATPGDHAWGSSSAPWAALFDGSRNLVVVASDPDIAEIQRISHSSLSLSDYANQLYLPPGASNLSPSEVSLMKEMLRGDKISAIADIQNRQPKSSPCHKPSAPEYENQMQLFDCPPTG